MDNQKKQFNTLFWLLQLGGWSLFTLANLFGRKYFVYFHISELINSLVLGVSLVISTCLLRVFYQRYLKSDKIFHALVQILLGSIVAGLVTMALYAAVIIPNQKAIFNVESDLVWQQILLGLPMIMFLVVAWSALYAAVKKQRLLKQARRRQAFLDRSLKDAQLDVFLSQINPHFIFNAINNIRALILEDSDKARDMLANLSEVMRHTMKIDKTAVVTLSNELEVVKQYVALNKLQFEDKLQVDFNIEQETLCLSLPPMILQLMVENAIKHGIGKLKQGGKIQINSHHKSDMWYISVENSGSYEPPNESGTGIGMNNIKQRLLLVFGQQSQFSVKASEFGVLAQVKIPL